MLLTIFMYGCTAYIIVNTIITGLTVATKMFTQAQLENGGKVGFTESIFTIVVGLLIPLFYLVLILALGAVVYYFPLFIGVF